MGYNVCIIVWLIETSVMEKLVSLSLASVKTIQLTYYRLNTDTQLGSDHQWILPAVIKKRRILIS